MRKIIVDTFGADNGPEIIIKGSLDALINHQDLSLVFVGNKDTIHTIIKNEYSDLKNRVEIIETDDYITNFEPPTVVLERQNSSVSLAYKRLKEDDECVGFLSAGNTGALLVGSIFKLGLIKGLKTPALSSAIPTANGNMVCLVDCGANIQCTPKDLVKFAIMGDAFIRSISPDKIPKVGLLSVGKEDGKGTPLIKETFGLLKELPLDFIGCIEGSDLTPGLVDVIVADGFAGNILLKSVESAGQTAKKMIEELSLTDKENAAIYDKINKKLSEVFDLNTRGGATFLGTQKSVIKMHGCAEIETPSACIDQLVRLDKAGFSKKVLDALTLYNNKALQ